MSRDKDIIYIFLHLQKCAGTTFHTHLDKSFRPDQRISLYEGWRTFDIPKGKWEYMENQRDIEQYLLSLSEEQKEKIQVIYGRDLYYGIHKHFTQTPRYIMFVREPTRRVISNYNYYRSIAQSATETNLQSDPSESHRKQVKDIYNEIYKDGGAVAFDYWVQHRAQSNYMVRNLIRWGFLDAGENCVSRRDIKRALQKFYFVGLTEHFDTDAVFLYHKLGIRGPYESQNVSEKYVTDNECRNAQEMILSKNSLDAVLYECARAKNRTDRRRHALTFQYIRLLSMIDFLHPVVSASYARMTSVRPLMFLYRMSAALKQRSVVYTKVIGFIKGT